MTLRPLLLLPLLFSSTAALAAEGDRLTAYNRPKLYVYDAAGAPTGEQVAKRQLPAPPVPIVAVGRGGVVGIRRGEAVIYFRSLDVTTSQADRPCRSGPGGGSRAGDSAYAAAAGPLSETPGCKPAD